MAKQLLRCLWRATPFLITLWLAAACAALPGLPSPPLPLQPQATLPPPLPTPKLKLVPTPTPRPEPTPTPLPLPVPDPEQAATLTEEGQARLLESDLVAAEAAFIDAIAADPNYLPAYLGLTRVYLYQPQYWQQALSAAGSAKALAPDDPTVLAYLAWAEEMAHHFDRAKETALRAVQLGPDNALAHAALADVLLSVYEVDEALSHAQQAVDLAEDSAEAWAMLAAARFAQHDWQAATEAYDRALELEPTFFAWHLMRAEHELDTSGDVYAAQQIAAPALEVQPNHAWSLSFQVDAAIEQRDWKTAEAGCQQMMALDQPHTPFPDPYTCMAAVMWWQERYPELEHYQTLAEVRATADRRDISVLRMRLHLDRDECKEARALAEDWLQARPYSVQAKRMMGLSYLCENDYDRALKYFQETYATLPRSVDDARLLAVTYARNEQPAEAMAVLNQVKPFALEDPTYYQALYEVLVSLNKQREALRAAQRWQVIRPLDTQPRVSIALVQLMLNNSAAAYGAAQSALADGESSATLYTVLGEVFRRQGDSEKAEQYLVKAVTRNPYHYLARDTLASFYVAEGRCQDALPHLQWLQQHTRDAEKAANLARTVLICQWRTGPLPTPLPSIALDDAAAVREARSIVKAAGAEPRKVELAEADQQYALIVAYATSLAPDSKEFADQEHEVALGLARLLPRIASQPDALLLISGSAKQAQNLTVIETWAATLWMQGQLSQEEFEQTWHRQRASSLQ